jgi:D-beta-D-heptose 7-phosphate kinase/D-beta-D-heptose 1-phosphate adenosyltransferase
LGNILVVGLNTDASVARLKGSERPINSEQERALILAELEAVDAIVLFDTDTPITLIETIQPDILVKGSDYVDKEIVGQEIVENTGGEVYLIPAIAGYSTTNLIKRIKGG